MNVQECNTVSELMVHWENKPELSTSYMVKNVKYDITINHKKDFFISDGIVDVDIWNSLPKGKRVLIILKEAYEDDKKKQKWALNDELRENGPWGAIWQRVSEWSYGVFHSTVDSIVGYKNLDKKQANDFLRKIAVLNIKKSGGKHSSVYEEISTYAEVDAEEIIREIELIDPDVVICGATFGDINSISGHSVKKGSNENWFYYSNAIGGKERLFIDYFHPANRYPALLNYYGIVGIYQQALKYKK